MLRHFVGRQAFASNIHGFAQGLRAIFQPQAQRRIADHDVSEDGGLHAPATSHAGNVRSPPECGEAFHPFSGRAKRSWGGYSPDGHTRPGSQSNLQAYDRVKKYFEKLRPAAAELPEFSSENSENDLKTANKIEFSNDPEKLNSIANDDRSVAGDRRTADLHSH